MFTIEQRTVDHGGESGEHDYFAVLMTENGEEVCACEDDSWAIRICTLLNSERDKGAITIRLDELALEKLRDALLSFGSMA